MGNTDSRKGRGYTDFPARKSAENIWQEDLATPVITSGNRGSGIQMAVREWPIGFPGRTPRLRQAGAVS